MVSAVRFKWLSIGGPFSKTEHKFAWRVSEHLGDKINRTTHFSVLIHKKISPGSHAMDCLGFMNLLNTNTGRVLSILVQKGTKISIFKSLVFPGMPEDTNQEDENS